MDVMGYDLAGYVASLAVMVALLMVTRIEQGSRVVRAQHPSWSRTKTCVRAQEGASGACYLEPAKAKAESVHT